MHIQKRSQKIGQGNEGEESISEVNHQKQRFGQETKQFLQQLRFFPHVSKRGCFCLRASERKP